LTIDAGYSDPVDEHVVAHAEVFGCGLLGHPALLRPQQRWPRQEQTSCEPARLILLLVALGIQEKCAILDDVNTPGFVTDNQAG
jgi:hypothetical protein